ncbi:MAG: zinc-ribbon domain-containing protein [Candidatus Krumholzibacteriia bacterium]
MQTNCPKCSQPLVLDDAKVPDSAFMLKCPKCQATVKLPGKGGTAAAAPAPVAPPAAPPRGKALVSFPSPELASTMEPDARPARFRGRGSRPAARRKNLATPAG